MEQYIVLQRTIMHSSKIKIADLVKRASERQKTSCNEERTYENVVHDKKYGSPRKDNVTIPFHVEGSATAGKSKITDSMTMEIL